MNGPELRAALQTALPTSSRADFCVGYFNLGGWKLLTPYLNAKTSVIEPYRILIGMPPDSDRELRKDILRGIPSDTDTLKSMAALLRERKVVVKISRRRQHSKFYLLYDTNGLTAGFLGSSNFTHSGLTSAGESNVALDAAECPEYMEQFASWWDDPSNTDFTNKLTSLIEARVTGCSITATATVDQKLQGEAESDRNSLIAFYHATGGSDWTINANWLSDKPLHEWYGVSISYGNRPNALCLASNNLSGHLPPELGSLTLLYSLDLSGNQLSGKIPVQLGNLFNLQTLNLSDNQLNDEIPPQLCNLYNLSTLDISDNQLSGQIPASLSKLSRLYKLDLNGNKLNGEIPSELGNLSSIFTPRSAGLRILNLSRNQLTGEIPPHLGELVSLDTLDLA